MGDSLTAFGLAFVPLFVAVDAIGLLPIFLALTEGFSAAERRRIVVESVATATAVSIGFLFAGQAVMMLLGITIADFMIAGGVLLFAFAMGDLFLVGRARQVADSRSVGAVPIGVPLVAGPAVLTTLLLVANQFGRPTTVLALLANMAVVAAIIAFAPAIDRLLGRTGTRTISKIMSLLMAAIAVKMVRGGIIAIWNELPR